MKKTKIQSMVNLNVNPCKMCMPMGAMTAFYGIKKCISILHGSQGCSTYIRRHMATHYNEPVDIASSSLTEQGTVYGGEDNLKKGLKNLIDVYQPEVVGVATTCLAETIGEDIKRIIENFYRENAEYKNVTIIPVHSAGYGGTQYEGYFAALCGIVSEVEMNTEKNDKINVITAPISPADTRYLKELFESFGLKINLLPDLSENLDGIHEKNYSKLPLNGIGIEEIKSMAGARCTIELFDYNLDTTPGKLLETSYQVPNKRMSLPIGLKATDALLTLLSELSGKEVSEKIKKERGRYLDGMIDSHKYNASGRAVIFGEPDFCISTVRLCEENGIMPIVVATGSECSKLKEYVEESIEKIAKAYFVEKYAIVDDADFKTIEELAVSYGANVMIGNSDGRRVAEKLELPLVRRGFPIHDRVGGQRLRMLGYEGSQSFLDEISNALLARREEGFRGEIYESYYKGTPIDTEVEKEMVEKKTTLEERAKKTIEEKTATHPCYNCAGHQYARIHLPVAPACNVQCNYCVRKFDCPNESRPGVTTKVLTPQEALERYKEVKEKMSNLTVVGIAGPGDALANFEETKQTLEYIREYDKDVTFCLSTNGLLLPKYAEELVDLGVSHVTVTINAVDPKIAGQIYKYINYMGCKFEGESAGALMISNQLNGLRILVAHGVLCKVNIVTLKGINDHHIPDVVRKVKEIGVFITNIMPHIPVEGSAFENNERVTYKEVEKLRDECGEILKQMYHCKQCRADAIGTLDNDVSIEFQEHDSQKVNTDETVYRYAVASKSGMLVDAHFGQVKEWLLYEYKNDEVVFVGKRDVEQYCNEKQDCMETTDKIDKIIEALDGCRGVIILRIGDAPKEKLQKKGIEVITTYDKIESAVKKAAQLERV